MANSYTEGTGLLKFDGPARITPVIRALFGPLRLNEEQDETDQYIAYAEGDDRSWRAIAESIEQCADAIGIDFTPAPDEQDDDDNGGDIAGWLMAIAARLKILPHPGFGAFIAKLEPREDPELSDLFDLACWLNDGHNLKAIQFEQCWRCDKLRLFEFGGSGEYISADLSLVSYSTKARDLGDLLQPEFDRGDMETVAQLLASDLRDRLACIVDAAKREQVRQAMLRALAG